MWRSKRVKVFDAVDKAVAAWLKAFTALIKVFTALIKVFTALVNVLTVLLKIFVVSVDVKKIRSSQWFEHRDFHATGDRCVLYFDAHIARKINPLCAEQTVVTVRICTACSPWWWWWWWWPRPGCTTAATRRGWTAGTRGGARRSWCGPPSTRRGAGGSTRECPEPGDPAVECNCVVAVWTYSETRPSPPGAPSTRKGAAQIYTNLFLYTESLNLTHCQYEADTWRTT